MKIQTWTKIKWPYNSDEPYSNWECWKLGNYILYPGQWPTEGWSYVAAFGANSDRSHSGFLKSFISIDSAKAEIERKFNIKSK